MEFTWKVALPAPVLAGTTIETAREYHGARHLGLFATREGHVAVLDAVTGRVLSTFSLPGDPAPVWTLQCDDVTGDGLPEVATGNAAGLVTVHALDGAVKWTHQCEGSVASLVLGAVSRRDAREVLVTSLDRTLRVLDMTDGALVWGQNFAAGAGPVTLVPDPDPDPEPESGQACSWVVAGGNDGTLRAFDARAGTMAWFVEFPRVAGTPMVRFCTFLPETRGVVVGADGTPVTLVNPATGDQLAVFDGPRYPWACEVARDARGDVHLLVVDYDFGQFLDAPPAENGGEKSARTTPRGAPMLWDLTRQLECRWRFRDPSLARPGNNIEALWTDGPGSLVFVGTSAGELAVLDLATGEVIDQAPAGAMVNVVVSSSTPPEDLLYLLVGTDAGVVLGVAPFVDS